MITSIKLESWNNQSESWITERHDKRGKKFEEMRGHFS